MLIAILAVTITIGSTFVYLCLADVVEPEMPEDMLVYLCKL